MGAVIAAGLVVSLATIVASVLKGKPWMAVLAFFAWPLALIPALRLAKPTSYWAQKHYGRYAMAKSQMRFPKAMDAAERDGRDLGELLARARREAREGF